MLRDVEHVDSMVLSRVKKFVYCKNVVKLFFFFFVMCRVSPAASIVQTTNKMETEAFGGGCVVEKLLMGGS